MITFTAYERSGTDADIKARSENILFIKEGVAWWALLFPVLWLLWNRMWVVLGLFVAVLLAVQLGLNAAGLPEALVAAATLLLSLLLALQGNDLKRWTLTQRGYEFAGLVSGRDLEECELRFFDQWLVRQRDRAPVKGPDSKDVSAKPAESPPAKVASGDDEVIGLFPDEGPEGK